MRAWALILGGLLVWAAHFFLVYAFGSLFPGDPLARWLTLAATVGALAADAAIIAVALPRRRRRDELDAWQARVGLAGAGVSFVAVAWQGLPAIV